MVKFSETTLDATFSALGDATRRRMLMHLARSEASVSELARPFAVTAPAISKHLRVLEEAGLISRRREGRVHHIRLEPEPLEQVSSWIAFHRQFWEEQFDALGRYLDHVQRKRKKQE